MKETFIWLGDLGSSTKNLTNDYGHHTGTETHKHRDTQVHNDRLQIDARSFPGV